VSRPDRGLSSGAKAGIAVGVILGVLIIAAICFFLFRRRRRRSNFTLEPELPESKTLPSQLEGAPLSELYGSGEPQLLSSESKPTPIAELDGSTPHGYPQYHAPGCGEQATSVHEVEAGPRGQTNGITPMPHSVDTSGEKEVVLSTQSLPLPPALAISSADPRSEIESLRRAREALDERERTLVELHAVQEQRDAIDRQIAALDREKGGYVGDAQSEK
jgi:hypothetical protein